MTSWTRRVVNNGSGLSRSASARFSTRLAKAVSMSRLVLAVRTSICRPMTEVAARASVILGSAFGLVGLTSMAKCAAPGSSSCKRPSRFPPISTEADTGDVAARLVEAGDETSLDRIEAAAEDDRNGRGRGFGRECRRYEVWRDDDGYPAADQIGRQFRQPIIVIVRPEVFDGHVLALDIASFAEPFSECCGKIGAPFG